jgi:DNA-binding LytR/AlgR family response regulator
LPIKTLIVEDEPHSLSRLKFLLQDIRQVEVIGTAESGEEAVRLIDELKPELLLLDIQLPGLTGFEALARARHRPAVIFITAFDQYAVRAFEENAVDYLLKPTSRERLEKAIEKAAQNLRPPDRELLDTLRKLMGRRRSGRPFTVKHKDEVLLIPEEDVYYFKAEDKYVFLCTADHSFFYEATLKELEETLDPDVFIRVHKGHLVAVNKIKKFHKWFLGDYVLELGDPQSTRLKIGRSYLAALRDKFKF